MPVDLVPFLISRPIEKERAIRLFWKSVNKGAGNGCWVWTKKNPLGKVSEYGLFRFQSLCGQWFYMQAHRFSLAMVDGVDKDLLACHSCDNPVCVRPDHLWWGTHKENMRDRSLKGRGWGVRNAGK